MVRRVVEEQLEVIRGIDRYSAVLELGHFGMSKGGDGQRQDRGS